MFWGFSEPIDFQTDIQLHHTTGPSPDELHILLLGSGDPRHILKSIATAYRTENSTTKIRFYMLEGCWEIIARNILLLTVALERSSVLSIKGKTHLFMDIYGNSVVRPASYNYICSKARHFTDAITDFDFAAEKMPIFDFRLLKSRERDSLQTVFDFWQHKTENVFNVATYWTDRVRADLASRYDSRNGAFDWDLQMKLKDYGAQQICPQEYKHWRDVGVAFVWPEYEQMHANKSLAAGLVRCGTRYQHRGYVGDIHVGPFCTFGLKCTDAALSASDHGTNRFRATDVSQRNIYELMYEITERNPYCYNAKDTHEFGGTNIHISKPFDCVATVPVNSAADLKAFNEPLIETDRYSVTILSPEQLVSFQNRPQFRKCFNGIFVARNYFDFLKKSEFASILADEAMVVFETKQYSILRREEISEFLMRIKAFAKDVGLKALTHFYVNGPIPIVRYKNVIGE